MSENHTRAGQNVATSNKQPRPDVLSPELQEAEQSGEMHTDAATSAPWHSTPEGSMMHDGEPE